MFTLAEENGRSTLARGWECASPANDCEMIPEPIDFIRPALRWEKRKQKAATVFVPNVVDTASKASIEIASAFFRKLGVDETEHDTPIDAGTSFEEGVAEFLRKALPLLDDRPWDVARPGRDIALSAQYSHFAKVRKLVNDDPALRAAIGLDYVIKHDVTVHLPRRFDSVGKGHPQPEAPLLHASVSCKWTLRSDRAQNVRTEAAALIKHRCGRVPHIAVVTAEPTVGRIMSIAQGTGELDAVFHIALPELIEATREAGFEKNADELGNLEAQGRLMDLRHLPALLAEW